MPFWTAHRASEFCAANTNSANAATAYPAASNPGRSPVSSIRAGR